MHWIDATLLRAMGSESYRGGAFGWIFLVLHGLMNLGRGSIHLFKGDGGAASIAGIDLTQNGEVILSLFAVFGFGQLLMGAIDLAVGLRFRALTPLLVGYYLIEQVATAWILWVWRPLPLQAPGKFGAVLLVPLVALALYSATRQRESGAPVPPPLAKAAR